MLQLSNVPTSRKRMRSPSMGNPRFKLGLPSKADILAGLPWALGGVAGVYASTVIPKPWSSVLLVAGGSSVAYGAFKSFAGPRISEPTDLQIADAEFQRQIEALISQPAGVNLAALKAGKLNFPNKEAAITYAAYVITQSGLAVTNQVWNTIEKYRDIGENSLLEAAIAGVAFFPIFPITVGIDVWWQGARQNEAVLAMQAVSRIAFTWMNWMTDSALPLFSDDFENSNATIEVEGENMKLSDAVSYAFDRVQQANAYLVDRLKGVKQLPPWVLQDAGQAFYKSLMRDTEDQRALVAEIAKAMKALANAAATVAAAGSKAITAGDIAPYVALGLGVVALGYFAL